MAYVLVQVAYHNVLEVQAQGLAIICLTFAFMKWAQSCALIYALAIRSEVMNELSDLIEILDGERAKT